MAQTLRIRTYRDGDAPALKAVFEASIRGLGRRDYTPEQVAAWIRQGPTVAAIHARCTDGRTTFVSLDRRAEIVAYIDLEMNGHLDHLYCRPEWAGTGAAAALYDELETLARHRNLERVFVEASEAARRFFQRRGFEVQERRSLTIQGVAMHNYAMAKPL
ncbi:MAG: GNAT family N-acetyltransferase [Pseudomonadota bacterium]